jgi:hypothetical protein
LSEKENTSLALKITIVIVVGLLLTMAVFAFYYSHLPTPIELKDEKYMAYRLGSEEFFSDAEPTMWLTHGYLKYSDNTPVQNQAIRIFTEKGTKVFNLTTNEKGLFGGIRIEEDEVYWIHVVWNETTNFQDYWIYETMPYQPKNWARPDAITNHELISDMYKGVYISNGWNVFPANITHESKYLGLHNEYYLEVEEGSNPLPPEQMFQTYFIDPIPDEENLTVRVFDEDWYELGIWNASRIGKEKLIFRIDIKQPNTVFGGSIGQPKTELYGQDRYYVSVVRLTLTNLNNTVKPSVLSGEWTKIAGKETNEIGLAIEVPKVSDRSGFKHDIEFFFDGVPEGTVYNATIEWIDAQNWNHIVSNTTTARYANINSGYTYKISHDFLIVVVD